MASAIGTVAWSLRTGPWRCLTLALTRLTVFLSACSTRLGYPVAGVLTPGLVGAWSSPDDGVGVVVTGAGVVVVAGFGCAGGVLSTGVARRAARRGAPAAGRVRDGADALRAGTAAASRTTHR